jgi:hypothetical protein
MCTTTQKIRNDEKDRSQIKEINEVDMVFERKKSILLPPTIHFVHLTPK